MVKAISRLSLQPAANKLRILNLICLERFLLFFRAAARYRNSNGRQFNGVMTGTAVEYKSCSQLLKHSALRRSVMLKPDQAA
jgi:hypothetical protein